MIDVWNAIWVGIVGGLAMSGMMAAARAAGLIDGVMERYQGCMITGETKGTGTLIAGLVMHLMISAIVALIYVWAFAAIWGEATWLLGLLLAVVHWLVGSLVLPLVDGMNRCVREGRIGAFGTFASKRGTMMVVGFLMGHLLYGAIVGWLYVVPAVQSAPA